MAVLAPRLTAVSTRNVHHHQSNPAREHLGSVYTICTLSKQIATFLFAQVLKHTHGGSLFFFDGASSIKLPPCHNNFERYLHDRLATNSSAPTTAHMTGVLCNKVRCDPLSAARLVVGAVVGGPRFLFFQGNPG